MSAFAFAYGVAVGVYKYFPYGVLHNAKEAAAALREKNAIPSEPHAFVVAHDKAGVTVHHPDKAFDGYTFLAAYRDGRHKAVLMDMAGNALHEWYVAFSDVWPDAPHIIEQAEDAAIHWHGSHLFPNGDVLFNFESGNFPYGGGLVKIDKDSNILWKLERNTYHDLDVVEDGTIFVAAHNYKNDSIVGLNNTKQPFLEDVILKVSQEGVVLEEISVLKALKKSDYRNLLPLKYGLGEPEDPTHLNTVEVLSRKLAAKFPIFEQGDLLVSLRNLNMIGIIDSDRRVVKWALVGMFGHQHDPDFMNNGHIMVFDNWGGRSHKSVSRILEIDPVTQRVVWRYSGGEEEEFFSEIRGKQQVLPNGNVLITESQEGRVLEVTRDAKREIVWEYYNSISPKDGERRVGLVTLALRIRPEEVSFLN